MMLFRASGSSAVLASSSAVVEANSRVRFESKSTVAAPSVDVLLLDGEYRQSLASMRAYARAGLRVGAAACEKEFDWAPSFKSRWCSVRASLPEFSTDTDAYVESVLALLDDHRPSMLLPAHDGSIKAVRSRRAEIERRTALPLASESALDIAVSKVRTLALAKQLGIAVPRSLPVPRLEDAPAVLNEIGLPLVVKPYESWVQKGKKGIRLSSEAFQTADAAMHRLETVFRAGGHSIVQQYLPGRREAVSLFYARGRLWARLAQVSHREWPVMGGASVLCETIPLLDDITSASERLVRAMDLEGCSMVEFRRDSEGRPVLMEVNPRMGGSVGLAIGAGVNFPRLAYDWKMERPLEEVLDYPVGRRMRWLAGDIWNLKAVFENQDELDTPSRRSALTQFLLDFVRPGNTIEGLEFDDLRPLSSEIEKAVLRHARGRLRRVVFPSNVRRTKVD
jgi:predicted ATP-grasp superfamily ATP-dependent carboligase